MHRLQPISETESDGFENYKSGIAMRRGEDPEVPFSRADGNLSGLFTLDTHKPHNVVARLITRRLPSEIYEVEQRAGLLRSGITRSKTGRTNSSFYTNYETKSLDKRKTRAAIEVARYGQTHFGLTGLLSCGGD